MELVEFVLGWLPPPPAHVLEVGCGSGRLALALAGRGHDVLAIDPVAPSAPIFRRVSLEELDEPAPFDAVVASRSLHHVEDLGAGLDRVVGLLGSEGVVVIDEIAWERMDETSADWYLGQQLALQAAGRLENVASSVEDLLAAWREEHEGLHDGDTMLAELDRRFERRHFARLPYLYRDLDGVASEGLEGSLIDADAIKATGFRYVGVARPCAAAGG